MADREQPRRDQDRTEQEQENSRRRDEFYDNLIQDVLRSNAQVRLVHGDPSSSPFMLRLERARRRLDMAIAIERMSSVLDQGRPSTVFPGDPLEVHRMLRVYGSCAPRPYFPGDQLEVHRMPTFYDNFVRQAPRVPPPTASITSSIFANFPPNDAQAPTQAPVQDETALTQEELDELDELPELIAAPVDGEAPMPEEDKEEEPSQQ